jgi:hypothetical protein
MKHINRILLAVLVVSISTAYSQSNTDNHQVSIVIPEIAMLDIESAGSNDISLTMVAPTDAGETIADQTDNSLWLNVTSIVTSSGTRDISVKLDNAITGLDLKVVSLDYSGSGFGSWGTAQSEIILSSTDQILVDDLRSGYTFNGAGNGYNLTYTASPQADADFGDLVANTENITVTYTLTL